MQDCFFRIIRWIVLITVSLSLGFSILVSDSLSRGKYYQLKFKLKDEKSLDRYIGLYTRKTLDADMLLFDENDKMIAKIAGSAGKYPNLFTFRGQESTSKGYSYSERALMVLSGRRN